MDSVVSVISFDGMLVAQATTYILTLVVSYYLALKHGQVSLDRGYFISNAISGKHIERVIGSVGLCLVSFFTFHVAQYRLWHLNGVIPEYKFWNMGAFLLVCWGCLGILLVAAAPVGLPEGFLQMKPEDFEKTFAPHEMLVHFGGFAMAFFSFSVYITYEAFFLEIFVLPSNNCIFKVVMGVVCIFSLWGFLGSAASWQQNPNASEEQRKKALLAAKYGMMRTSIYEIAMASSGILWFLGFYGTQEFILTHVRQT